MLNTTKFRDMLLQLLASVALLASAAAAPPDSTLAWLREHAQDLLRELQVDGLFTRAADEGRPANYLAPQAMDLAHLVHGAADIMDHESTQVAVATTLLLLRQPAETPQELPARAWLLASLENLTANHSLLCTQLPSLWHRLQDHYSNASVWRDALSFSAEPRVAGVETVLSSGHDTFLTLLHYRGLSTLVTAAERAKCDPTPMQGMNTVMESIRKSLLGPLLWNDDVGMFRPSSGNNAKLTDVWGSALAVDTGAVTGDRAARIVAWFGAHWGEVVQDGQIRHLPAVGDASGMPSGEYWPQTTTWEHGTYANGGYWASASGWVLPVIARSNYALGQQLVHQAIITAQRGSLSEWRNAKFCCNCQGAASWTSLCMTPYPSTASLDGVRRYGRSVFSVYSAAKRLLGTGTVAVHQGEPPAPPAAEPSLHAKATAAVAAKQLQVGDDPDLVWLTEYATMYQAQARECTGCTGCVQPPYDGCFFPPAADPGRPAAYSELWCVRFKSDGTCLFLSILTSTRRARNLAARTYIACTCACIVSALTLSVSLRTRDFEYTMEFLYPLFDDISKRAALDQTLYILRNRPAGNCSARAHHNPGALTTDKWPSFPLDLHVIEHKYIILSHCS
eukprot:SAG31_NODE_2358_length_5873_cov_12.058019_2_plen_621_part_00